MKRLYAFDLVILGYLTIISAIVVVFQPHGWWIYLAYHVAVAALIAMLAHAHDRYGGRFWDVARYWYVIPVVLGTFRELHHLFIDPACPPFNSPHIELALAKIDRAVLGDVDAFFLSVAQPQFTDFLHLCYWSYYLLAVAPGAIPFFLGERKGVRESVTIVVAALYLSYLGYFLVPAIGPHHFFAERPPELDGWILGRFMYPALMGIEWRMPDAFPSGHALISIVALLIAWKRHRPTFWVLLVPAIGCVWSTMALRYHYVVDVAAGLAILPVAMLIGIRLNAWCERQREAIGLGR